MMKQTAASEGFTIIEVIVTIVVALLFIGAIAQLYVAQYQLSSSVVAYTHADILAYNNLRTYAYGASPTWFVCSGSAPYTKNYIQSGSTAGIPGPVTQTVTATAPFGCGGSSSGYPIQVVSTVTYGPNNRKVVHATYATY